MITDRLTGAALLALGGLLWLAVIPAQVETVEYGWLRPRTLPYIVAALVALCGLVLMARPADEPPRHTEWARLALFAGILVAGLALIHQVGFVLVAPGMALVLMLAAGERRWVWLLAGAAGTPAAIWLCVVVLLERPLP